MIVRMVVVSEWGVVQVSVVTAVGHPDPNMYLTRFSPHSPPVTVHSPGFSSTKVGYTQLITGSGERRFGGILQAFTTQIRVLTPLCSMSSSILLCVWHNENFATLLVTPDVVNVRMHHQ